MNNFDEIIKQKVEQFDVPFNEAHWAEMDGKLNTIRAAKIKKTILGSAAAIAIIAAAGYFTVTENDTAFSSNDVVASNNITEQATFENNSIEHNLKTNNNVEPSVKTLIKPDESTVNIESENLEEGHSNSTTIDNTNSEPKESVLAVVETSTYSNEKANPEFIVYNNQVCLGEEVSFESQENDQPVSYTWNFGDGTISHEKNPSHRYKNSRVYSVSLTLLNRQTGQETTSIQNDIVKIIANPNPSFKFSETSTKHDDNKLKYPYTTFNLVEQNNNCSYKWSYGNGETSMSSSGKTIYKKTGDFTATLIVKNNNTGCSAILKKKVSILNGFDLFAPTAFTPNNNGGNETFIPKAILGWDTKFEMIILNKSGKTIYSTSDKNEAWNGKLNNNGQVLPDGIYLWKVITYDAENNAHRHHGKITLMK